MKLPETEDTLFVRTEFSDDAAWEALCTTFSAPRGEFRAYVHPVSDAAFDGATVEQLVQLAAGTDRSFVFVADRVALTDPEHPVLVIDVLREPGRRFRVVPAAAWAVENNLSIANMDFAEFADAADEDGVFRGFPQT